MQVYPCSHCGHLVFFDSMHCVRCGSTLAFVPEAMALRALEPAPGNAPALWQERSPAPGAARYRLCTHRDDGGGCNFALPAHSPHHLCLACRQTHMLPALTDPLLRQHWARIEAAKRQLFYTLARLGLQGTADNAAAQASPRYALLADQPGGPAILTGHQGGTITLNVAEADDVERARRRLALHEPYRTLLGHLRHESGHFYWERLVQQGGRLDAFRALFGDERRDYAAALSAHYADGPPPDWQEQHVSAYATAHPWEDWAETWAHYLHMVDLLETASAYDTALRVPGAHGIVREQVANPFAHPAPPFDTLVRQWVPLTLLLNSLNRSLGQPDAYPFALSAGAWCKLRFVHDTVQQASSS
ncbi:zinc-binding metallopeptidase family protein [Simplicispira sedimenti]|uniref:zinc-binding metallopeptidase family protein n=1 Tax=Simplicispira sedimenti TaxID=2919500 RepID=UPI001FAA417F|nr:putative zinc-binding metallopeptidase [Acidovorax sp. W1-6]